MASSHDSDTATPSPARGRSTSPLAFEGQTIATALFHPGLAPQVEDGSHDPKRRRIARACDMCRKKKIRCDGKAPACTHCLNYKTECVFTLVEKKRNPPKGAKYIEGLENRLGRMESLLRLSGLLPDEKTDLRDLERRLTEQREKGMLPRTRSAGVRSSSESLDAITPSTSSHQSNPNSPKHKSEEDVENLSDMMCSLVTTHCGETRFIGSSSGLSIFSPRGIQWVNEKTGDNSFQEMVMKMASSGGQCSPPKQDPLTQMSQPRVRNPLPPADVAAVLVGDYFRFFNNQLPLFHKPTFLYLLDKQYSEDPPADSGWYAAYNMVLALCCRMLSSHSAHIELVLPWIGVEKSWAYFQNAYCVLPEMLLKNTDLLSIQSVLAMSLFLQGTANPQPSYFLIGAAARIANSIGMHRRGSWFGLNPAEVEQRRRVFWIIYLLDKEMTLRSGRPGAISDDDVNVELPEEDPPDGVGNIPLSGGKKVNLFRLLAQFSQIEGKVYIQLYSAKASRQSDQELLNTIGDLDRELEKWKESVPLDIRPDHDIKIDEGPLVLHVVGLHFAYYSCLTTIHRMSIHHGYWTSRLSNYAIAGLSARPLNPRVFNSATLCVAAARMSIQLLKYMNEKDYPCVWLILYYPVSALVTLFANILQNPQDPRARSDVQLMNRVCEFLQQLKEYDEGGNVHRMLAVCFEFDRIAKVVLDKAEKEVVKRRKRKADEVQQNSSSNQPEKSPLPIGVTIAPQADPNHFHRSSTANTPSASTAASPSMINQQLFDPSYEPFAQNSGFAWFGDLTFHFPQTNYNLPTSPSPGMGQQGGPLDPTLSPLPFQQPFVPQDLWQMPMTLEWDWADLNMSGLQWNEGPPG